MTTEHSHNARLLTPVELAGCIKSFREIWRWSQEQLAAISGLNVRTIQRVEQGLPASLDTRRTLARAFGFDDIDVFEKPFNIPDDEALRAEKEKFDREHVTLKATPLTTGKQLAKLAETCTMDMTEPAFDLGRDVDEVFAALVDYLREYRDCADLYSETQKFEVYDEIQSYIDDLKIKGVALRYAVREVKIKWVLESDSTPMPATILYLVGFPLGEEPDHFATPRAGRISL